MTQQNIKFTLDIGKILVGIIASISFIFYAGKVDQKVTDIDTRLSKVEEWKEHAQMEQDQLRAEYNKNVPVKSN